EDFFLSTERPKPAVSIQPDDQVFSGETVTLRCDIQGGGVSNWQYSWFKAGSSTAVSNEQQYSISPVTASDRGTYTCIGAVSGTSRNSHTSDAATLTVSDLPKPTLTVEPERPVFSGESVALKCEIKDYDGWTYQWYKHDKQSELTAVSQSDYHTVDGDTLTIRGDTVINGDQYLCRGERRDRPTSSEYSSSVTLTVEALPTAELTVEPKWSPVFIGESVTLKCEIKGYAGWTYQWYKHDKQSELTAVSQSEHHTVNGDTLTIRADTVINGEQYWCRGERHDRPTSSEYSSSVTLTVNERPKPAVSIQPDHQVFRGETVTLRCEIKGGGVSNWQYSWFKDGSSTPVSYKQQYSISSVTASDGGTYTCRGAVRGTSRYSHYSEAVTLTVSGKPKPTVRADPRSSVYTGDTVTLTCEVKSTGWEFLWYKDSQPLQPQSPVDKGTKTLSVTVSHAGTAEFRCAARRGAYTTQTSAPAVITVTARPKATVTIHPADPVFIGETVTLTCDIGSGHHWQYYWFKNSKPLSEAQQRNEYTISNVAASHRGVYTCKGRQSTQPRYSETSDAVTLTVSEKPKPELTSSHKGAALIGNPVVLYCELDQSAGWRFYWSKHTQSPENETKPETHSYTISSVSVSDGGQYWCRAGRGTPVYYTHYSDALWINVTGTTRSDSLTVSPSRAQHFSAGSLSLSCEEQSNSTGWRVRRYTHSETVSDCSSGLGSVTGSTCNISSLSTSHTGVYWCESESGESSNPVNITVTSESVLFHQHHFCTNLNVCVTLRCLYRDPKPSNLTAEFYKNGSLLQTQTTGEMTIRTVSKSDEGLYHCKHPERGESPQSWISVRGSDSKTVILAVSVVLSLVLILIIILGLFWCYKKKKGDQQNTNQTPDQSQSPGSTQLQTDSGPEPGDVTYAQIDLKDKKKPKKTQDKLLEDDSAGGSGDLTYAQVKTKKKKSRGKATPSDEVTYSQIAMKSLKQDSKDSGPEPGDVTYAQIDLKEKKKPKKTQNKLRGGP
uniref:Ig-like domain-containing protein n=1 Tax=Pygocentrus nattereri TaxID=42514 RepID=A0AAR2KMB3_PYGNA